MQELNDTITTISSAGVNCPECKAHIDSYNQPKGYYYGCPQCGTFFEYKDGNAKVLRLFNDESRATLAIPLGTKAQISGSNFVMVGYMKKVQADDDEIFWHEYAFYCPGENWYVIFAEYSGHWMEVWRAEQQNFEVQQSITGIYNAKDDNLSLQLRLSYRFNVTDAQGAFDWNILDDEELDTYEYVAPPHILVNEVRGQKSDWFRAKYISPAAIKRVMDVSFDTFPSRSWPGIFNPSKFYPAWKPLLKFTGVLLVLFICLNLFEAFVKPAKEVFASTFACQPDTSSWGNSKAIVTPSFQIDGPTPLQIKLRSNSVDNSWMELPVALVNDKDGKVYEVLKSIEYYHGVDGGESWTEGDRDQEAMLSGIPSGSYHLNIYPTTENKPTDDNQMSFDVSVTQNAFVPRNFWLMLLLIITVPVVQLIRKYYYENSKWFDKDYGSLTTE